MYNLTFQTSLTLIHLDRMFIPISKTIISVIIFNHISCNRGFVNSKQGFTINKIDWLKEADRIG